MKEHKVLFLCIAMLIGYPILLLFIHPESLRLTIRGLSVGVSIVIVVTWASAALYAIRQGVASPRKQLVFATFATWLSILLTGLYAALSYLVDLPLWFRVAFAGFLAMTVLVSGILVLIAPGTMPGAVPHRYKYHVGIGLGLGTLIAAFLLGVTGEYTIGIQ